MEHLIWLDLENSGLGPNFPILEIACFVTNLNLEIVDKWEAVLPTPPHFTFEQQALEMHKKSGLMRHSQRLTALLWRRAYSDDAEDTHQVYADLYDQLLLQLEDDLVKKVRPYLQGASRKPPLCGNSPHYDRQVLEYHFFGKFLSLFSHQNIDVTTTYLLTKLFSPQNLPPKNDENNHRAGDDLRRSIEYLKFFCKSFFEAR